MEFHQWSSVLRVVTYTIIAPGFLWFCFDYWSKNSWLSALFLVLAIERFYVLASVSFDVILPGSKVWTLDGLTPIVLFMAVIMVRLLSGRMLARGLQWSHQRVLDHGG